MYSDYHKLTAYNKSKLLTTQIINNLAPKISNQLGSTPILNQIIRSSTSIGANIAEGYGRNNTHEYRQFLGIARGSCMETAYWLEIIQESYNIQLSDIISLNTEIVKLLTTTIKNLK